MQKESEKFDVAHLARGLTTRLFKGGATNLFAQFASTVISLLSVVILARILRPQDFGLVAMVTGITGVLHIFKDAGLASVTVQRSEISHDQVSNLFWLNTGFNTLLSILIVLLAPLLERFYGEPEVRSITVAVGVIFFLGGLTIQHRALLQRQMQFLELAIITLISQAVALIAAILAALAGFGYWALVVQMAVSQVLFAIITLIITRWLPGRPRRGLGTWEMVRFGGYLTGFSFLNYFARNFDRVLIGRVWGDSALGFYAKAYALLLLPIHQVNGPINEVATPALSRLQHDSKEFRRTFVAILNAVCFLTFPLIAWLIVVREEIILLLLGPQWEQVIPIFTALAASAFFQPVGNITGVLYIALGRAQRMFWWGVISSIWIVLAFLVGIRFGPVGVAVAYSTAIFLIIVPLILFGIHGTPIKLIDYWRASRVTVYVTIVSGLAASGVKMFFAASKPDLVNILLVTLTFGFCFLGLYSLISPEIFKRSLDILMKRAGSSSESTREC